MKSRKNLQPLFKYQFYLTPAHYNVLKKLFQHGEAKISHRLVSEGEYKRKTIEEAVAKFHSATLI